MIGRNLSQRRNNCRGLAALAVAISVGSSAWGFSAAALGDKIADAVLPGLDGGQHHLFTDAAANVFIFVKPGQEHSEVTLRQFAQLEKEMVEKSVRFVAIVSDQIPRTKVEATRRASGVVMPILFDRGDALFTQLGVTLEPCTGIVGADHHLTAYLPFTKVNQTGLLRAHIRHLLKEIDDAELARIGSPVSDPAAGNREAARRRLRLAEKLFESKLYPQALANAQASIAKDPTVAAAHALLGDIYSIQKSPDEALRAYQRALELAPTFGPALRGKAALEQNRLPP
jgi:hypothetical protein